MLKVALQKAMDLFLQSRSLDFEDEPWADCSSADTAALGRCAKHQSAKCNKLPNRPWFYRVYTACTYWNCKHYAENLEHGNRYGASQEFFQKFELIAGAVPSKGQVRPRCPCQRSLPWNSLKARSQLQFQALTVRMRTLFFVVCDFTGIQDIPSVFGADAEDIEALTAMEDAVASSWKQIDLSESAKRRLQDVVRSPPQMCLAT